MGLILASVGGLFAGAAHVVSGPDHLAAVLPLAVHGRWRAAAVGAFWGVGHAAGVLALGALGFALRGWLDIEVVSGWSELAVGALLIGLGGWAIWRTRASAPSPSHRHSHGSAMGIGFLHGTAGAGHVFGVLPSLALPWDAALAWLAAYMAAAVAAMALFSLGVGSLVLRPSWAPWALRLAGLAAIGVGVVWIAASLAPAHA